MRAALCILTILGALAFAGPAGAVGSPWDTTFSGDGKATTDFGSNDDAVGDVVVQPDGKIVVAGTRGGDFGAFAVARYNTDGSLDTSFNGDGKAENSGGFGTGSEGHGVALQADGKIVVAGNVCGLLGCDFQLQRYRTDGSLDTSFHADGTVGISVGGLRNDSALAVAVQPDGKIVAAGETCEASSGFDCDVVVMRLQSDGSLDSSFAGGIVVTHFAPGHFLDVGVQVDGTVVAAGFSGGFPSPDPMQVLLARYGPSGLLLGVHSARYVSGSSLGEMAEGLAIQPDGRIVLAGRSGVSGAAADFAVARFDSAGVLDPSFSADGMLTTSFGQYEYGTDIALQPDGHIVVVGNGLNVILNGNLKGHLVRYTTAGDLDPGFNGDGRFTDVFPADAVAIAPDRKIVVAGTVDGDFVVSRFVENGGDGTKPVLTVPGTIVAEATSAAGAAVTYSVSATDNMDPTPDVACTPASGSTFRLGFSAVTCRATDDAGNSVDETFFIRVVDTTAPTITAGPIRVNADSAVGAVVNYLVGVQDAVDPSPSLNCQPPSGSLFPVGTTTVTCAATDATGNRSERSFRIIVVGFRDQVGDLLDAIANLPLTGQADVRRDSALQFCVNAFAPANWASNGMPRTNDAGRFALQEIRQCVLYLMGPPAEVATASASIRLALITLVCRIAHLRYDEVNASGGANGSRLVQARTSLEQADAAPGTNGALFDCVNAWAILRNEPPQYTS
jgi:uncharacterized delta-60 repeat protein